MNEYWRTACRIDRGIPGHHATFDLDCRLAPTLGTVLLSPLEERFLPADLLASGVATELADGLVLNSALLCKPDSIVGLRVTESAALCDIDPDRTHCT